MDDWQTLLLLWKAATRAAVSLGERGVNLTLLENDTWAAWVCPGKAGDGVRRALAPDVALRLLCEELTDRLKARRGAT